MNQSLTIIINIKVIQGKFWEIGVYVDGNVRRMLDVRYGLEEINMNRITTGLLLCAIIASGCATTPASNKIAFRVTSDPPGCPIEVNGIASGVTPTTIYLGSSKYWVGLLMSPNGWAYGNQQYQVTCLPPPDSKEPLVSQTKVISPGMTPQGARIAFNLRLRPVHPTQPIEINKQEKSEIIIRDERVDPPQSSTAADRLRELKKLRDDGLITEEEFKQKRQSILKEL